MKVPGKLLFHITKQTNCNTEHCTIIAWQGEFPDENTQEDGYAGVAPVDAFLAQNKFGKRSIWIN